MTNSYSDTDLLRRYLRGDIDARQEAELERRATLDAGLRTAMEGIRIAPEHDHPASVSRMLAKARTGAVPKPATRRWRPSRYWWGAAACLLLLFALVFEFSLGDDAPPEIAMNDLPVESEAAPAAEPRQPPPPPADTGEETARIASRPAPATAPDPAPFVQNTAPASSQEKQRTEDVEAEIALEEVLPPEEVVAEETAVILGEAAGAMSARAEPRADEVKSEVSKTAPPANYLNGRVLDENGNPIFGASIRLPGQPIGPTTDSAGTFRIDLDAVSSQLLVIADGYESETIEIDPAREDLQINLEAAPSPESDALFEQTGAVETLVRDEVTGELRRQDPTGLARPDVGFRSLRRRIVEERPADVPTGRVRVNFLVQPDGRLTNFRFRGRAARATEAYVRRQLLDNSDWSIVRGKKAVRVHLRVNLR